MDQTESYTRNISNNKESLKIIANAVSGQLKRTLTAVELRDLWNFVCENALRNWSGYSIQQIRAALSGAYLKTRFTVSGRKKIEEQDDVIDVHEMLKIGIGSQDQEPNYETVDNVDTNGFPTVLEGSKSETDTNTVDTGLGSLDSINTVNKLLSVGTLGNIKAFLGKTDDTSIQQMLNPQAAWRKNYILLDSRYRDTETDGMNAISWSFLSNTSENTPGGINSLGDVKQIVAISCPRIRIPYKDVIMLNGYRRVSLLINEFSGQSYIGQEGRRFHFMFSTAVEGNMIELVPLQDVQSTFEFAKPITQIDKLTLTFGNPLEKIMFDADRLPMQIQYNNPATFVSSVPHNLQTGDQVYFTNFTTLDPVTDNILITRVNQINGYNIIRIDDETIQIDELDFSTIASPITPFQLDVFFGSKRIFVPLEIKYIATIVKSLQ